MRINPIQQNQNYGKNNFKGNVSSGVTQLLGRCAKNEAKNYVANLEKGVSANRYSLLDIQRSWSAILNRLNEKVSKMHPDINMTVERSNNLDDELEESFDLCYENRTINTTLHSLPIRMPQKVMSGVISSKEFDKYVEELEPKQIEKDMLDTAIKNYLRDLKKGDVSNLENRALAICDYQSQLGHVTLEERMSNSLRMNIASRATINERAEKERIETIEQDNSKLLDEIFGTDN